MFLSVFLPLLLAKFEGKLLTDAAPLDFVNLNPATTAQPGCRYYAWFQKEIHTQGAVSRNEGKLASLYNVSSIEMCATQCLYYKYCYLAEYQKRVGIGICELYYFHFPPLFEYEKRSSLRVATQKRWDVSAILYSLENCGQQVSYKHVCQYAATEDITTPLGLVDPSQPIIELPSLVVEHCAELCGIQAIVTAQSGGELCAAAVFKPIADDVTTTGVGSCVLYSSLNAATSYAATYKAKGYFPVVISSLQCNHDLKNIPCHYDVADRVYKDSNKLPFPPDVHIHINTAQECANLCAFNPLCEEAEYVPLKNEPAQCLLYRKELVTDSNLVQPRADADAPDKIRLVNIQRDCANGNSSDFMQNTPTNSSGVIVQSNAGVTIPPELQSNDTSDLDSSSSGSPSTSSATDHTTAVSTTTLNVFSQTHYTQNDVPSSDNATLGPNKPVMTPSVEKPLVIRNSTTNSITAPVSAVTETGGSTTIESSTSATIQNTTTATVASSNSSITSTVSATYAPTTTTTAATTTTTVTTPTSPPPSPTTTTATTTTTTTTTLATTTTRPPHPYDHLLCNYTTNANPAEWTKFTYPNKTQVCWTVDPYMWRQGSIEENCRHRGGGSIKQIPLSNITEKYIYGSFSGGVEDTTTQRLRLFLGCCLNEKLCDAEAIADQCNSMQNIGGSTGSVLYVCEVAAICAPGSDCHIKS